MVGRATKRRQKTIVRLVLDFDIKQLLVKSMLENTSLLKLAQVALVAELRFTILFA